MGKIKRIAGTDEPAVGVEVIVEIVEVQVPPIAIPVEVRHITVAIRILPDIMCKIPSVPPPLEVFKTISGLNRIRYLALYHSILHQVSLFFRKSGATLAKALTIAILRFPKNQNSAT